MAKRFRFVGNGYRPHFMRQWRDYRRLSLDAMSEAIVALTELNGGLSKASLSRIETGKTPYTRDTLEAYAIVLGCEPVDLLSRPPTDPEGLWTIFSRLRDDDKARAAAMLRARFSSDRGDDAAV